MTDLPRIQLARLDRMVASISRCFHAAATAFSAEEAVRVAHAILDIESLQEVSQPFLVQTLLQYVGKPLSGRLINVVARQIAARAQELAYMPLPAFLGVSPGWAAFEVIDARPVPWRDTSGHVFRLYTLTGAMAGTIFERKFPDAWLVGLAYRLGYSRRTVYSDDARDMIGFRFWALVARKDDDQRTPELSDIEADPQVKKHNREIIKRRTRFDKELDEDPCAEAFEHPCSACTVTDARCPAAFIRTVHGHETA